MEKPGHDGAKFDKLKTALNLSEAQVAQLNSNQEKVKAEINAVVNDQSLSQEQKKEKIQEIKNQSKESLKSILTPEQQKKWKS